MLTVFITKDLDISVLCCIYSKLVIQHLFNSRAVLPLVPAPLGSVCAAPLVSPAEAHPPRTTRTP